MLSSPHHLTLQPGGCEELFTSIIQLDQMLSETSHSPPSKIKKYKDKITRNILVKFSECVFTLVSQFFSNCQ